MSVDHTATEDNSDNEQIEAEIRQQIENTEVPLSLPEKAVAIQIHTGMLLTCCCLRLKQGDIGLTPSSCFC